MHTVKTTEKRNTTLFSINDINIFLDTENSRIKNFEDITDIVSNDKRNKNIKQLNNIYNDIISESNKTCNSKSLNDLISFDTRRIESIAINLIIFMDTFEESYKKYKKYESRVRYQL